jgi:hypothetical protein
MDPRLSRNGGGGKQQQIDRKTGRKAIDRLKLQPSTDTVKLQELQLLSEW